MKNNKQAEHTQSPYSHIGIDIVEKGSLGFGRRSLNFIDIIIHCIPSLLGVFVLFCAAFAVHSELAYLVLYCCATMLLMATMLSMVANLAMERNKVLLSLVTQQGFNVILLGFAVLLAAVVFQDHGVKDELRILSILLLFCGYAMTILVISEPVSQLIISFLERFFRLPQKVYPSSLEVVFLTLVALFTFSFTANLAEFAFDTLPTPLQETAHGQTE